VLSQQLAKLESQLQKSETQSSELTEALDKTKSKLTATLVERTEFVASRDVLKQQVKAMEERLTSLRDSHEVALKKITRRTVADIRKIESIIAKTGLDTNKLLKSVNPEVYGVGGPFVIKTASASIVDEGMTALDLHLAHWEDLQKLISQLPLVAPLDHYKLGSEFGRRRDPINGKWAEHQGVDLSTSSRSPIFATGGGKVVYRGWKGQYGRVVEIDHGFGVKTRYAHMRRILVRRGQRVELGQKIGQVGTSGRSTGPHVHYEILINGKPIDPLKFIQAGKDVFKG
jgi:murein DD-endopeptidase MepM/ murein hydrolase activator NlpD